MLGSGLSLEAEFRRPSYRAEFPEAEFPEAEFPGRLSEAEFPGRVPGGRVSEAEFPRRVPGRPSSRAEFPPCQPSVGAALDDSNSGNWLIMDRIPGASFGIMKTMVLTLLGREMIIIIHQYLIFKA